MKYYPGPDGQRRIWFARSEIEFIMEEFLRKACLYPTASQPVVDVEKFLENHLNVRLNQYADLDTTVLGVTSFVHKQDPIVEINKDLTGAMDDFADQNVSKVGRWRATLAHEAAHVILHGPSYRIPSGQSTFFEESAYDVSSMLVIRCFKKNVGFGKRQGDWREYQANMGMAALIMPKSLLIEMVKKMSHSMIQEPPELGTKKAQLLITQVSDIFQVSNQAAKIRLTEAGIVTPAGQTQLKTS